MSANPSRSVFLGAESLLIQCAETALGRGHEIIAVVTSSDEIRRWAASHDITTIPADGDYASALGEESFDYLFAVTHLALIPEAVLRLPRLAAINFHDGPLPQYAGLNVPAWALLAGEESHGITWHLMSSGLDEGDVLLEQTFDIAPQETALSLNARCYEAAIETFPRLLDQLAAEGTSTSQPQDLSKRRYFGRDDRPTAACTLDWSKPASELVALIRAVDYGPRYANPLGFAKVRVGDRVVRVVGAEWAAAAGEALPGEVLAADRESVTVAAAVDAVRLMGFEELDGRPLPASELGLVPGARLAVLDGDLAQLLSELNAAWAPAEGFWRRRLMRLEPVELPYLRSGRGGRVDRQEVTIPPAFVERFGGDASTALAAFALFLRRLTGKSLLHLAYRDAERVGHARHLRGMVSEKVPMRVAVEEEEAFDTALDAIRDTELARLARRGTFWLDLIGRTPELRQRADLQEGRLLPVAIEVAKDTEAATLYPGEVLGLVLDASGTRASWCYDTAALSAEDATSLLHHFETFLAHAAAQPDCSVSRLHILEDSQRRQILDSWNATAVDFPRHRCIHHLIAEQAARTPQATAVTFRDQQLTYQELENRASRLAAYLGSLGIGPDRTVGIHVDRSLEMVVAMLGVLKAGGAYVPLDPTYPRERIDFMIQDSGVAVVLTKQDLVGNIDVGEAQVVRLDADWQEIERCDAVANDGDVEPHHLAYVIYTSGSTGLPKGVMVEHRNVVNFFTGMDERVAHEAGNGSSPGSWLAVTSLSFDISVLELLWTLARGFKVVVFADTERRAAESSARFRPLDFGLFFWGNDDGPGPQKYRLLLDAARFADERGFSSVSTPERHFHAFGGPFPNPSVTSAAIAAVTERVQIRAGSCVVPLHHPIRVAEEWAVVDNLSNGRVAIAFASGWQPNDFVLRPESFHDVKKKMLAAIETVRELWRGEAVEQTNPFGDTIKVSSLPRPVQGELPVWLTTAGNTQTYEMAGAAGFNVLTHLLGQSIDEVGQKILAYREARRAAGFDPDSGKVTLMLHTFVGEDDEEVKALVRQPMKDYLASSLSLVKGFAWAFPAFKRPKGKEDRPDEIDLDALSDEDLDTVLEFAFERYYETSGLFGTQETCARTIERVKAIGVDEIACLIDYGVPTERVLESLELLDRVRLEANTPPRAHAEVAADYSLEGEVARHEITHLQCTPSMAKMMAMSPDMRGALGSIDHLMIGGEAFPDSLARELGSLARGTVTNMYGPTETTIWSTTQPVGSDGGPVSIGTPIANTQIYIVDKNLEPVPVGVPGELLIGGDGVVRGYHNRPELTAERFIPDPFRGGNGARLYRTGDLARFKHDGTIEFLGRLDHQVKIRGYRIELGEIESVLGRQPGLRECVVVAREDTPGDVRLVAYCVAEDGKEEPSAEILREALKRALPEFMVPQAFAFLPALPLTPNGKIDRKALPAPDQLEPKRAAEYAAPANEIEVKVAAIWQDVLGLERVGREDNFFDLGGHSLLVVQVHRQLREALEQPISLTDLYRFPTIRSLVEHLSQPEEPDARAEQSRRRVSRRREVMRQRRMAR